MGILARSTRFLVKALKLAFYIPAGIAGAGLMFVLVPYIGFNSLESESGVGRNHLSTVTACAG